MREVGIVPNLLHILQAANPDMDMSTILNMMQVIPLCSTFKSAVATGSAHVKAIPFCPCNLSACTLFAIVTPFWLAQMAWDTEPDQPIPHVHRGGPRPAAADPFAPGNLTTAAILQHVQAPAAPADNPAEAAVASGEWTDDVEHSGGEQIYSLSHALMKIFAYAHACA